MKCVFKCQNKFFIILFLFLQIRTCLLQSQWKTQKRNTDSGVANKKHSASIIFLHGLGDTGDRWTIILNTVKSSHIKIISPSARVIPITINHGTNMSAWFDIKGLDQTLLEDSDGIKNATAFVHSLIEKEISSGIPSNRIIIGGFSQGGALALHAGLTYHKRLAGIIALSCWLPLSNLFTPSLVTANRNIHILQCHGELDRVVPYGFGQLTAFFLQIMTKNFEFKTYPGLMHSVSPSVLADIERFIKLNLPVI